MVFESRLLTTHSNVLKNQSLDNYLEYESSISRSVIQSNIILFTQLNVRKFKQITNIICFCQLSHQMKSCRYINLLNEDF